MEKHIVALLCLSAICLLSGGVHAQTFAHGQSSRYVYPTEPEVRAKLDQWQDQKFGMLIHYGLYTQLGIVESWSICSEEQDWITRDSTMAYDEYKRYYWSMINHFKPEKLEPSVWAEYGKKAGMNYVVFTTKHHDGFNMFDTKQTDFSITKGAFKDDARSNIAKEVFNAFRQKGFMIGAYFSKPDWHSQYYWWDRYATPNRNKNYSIVKNPWRWKKFKEYTYNQIEELVNGDYGSIDILWLDGGWVSPGVLSSEPKAYKTYQEAQDIDMPKIARMVRSYQPSMLIVDRMIAGEYENYQTPERGIPDRQIDVPWESCIPLGNDWGYVPTDQYKNHGEVIHQLVEIVAKGGSLLLGIGPKPDGTLPEAVMKTLEKIGGWTSRNGEAIYNTRITPVYNDGNTWFTQSKGRTKIYAIHCFKAGSPLPTQIIWKGNEPTKGSKIVCLHTGKTVKWAKTPEGIYVQLPENLPPDMPAIAFSYTITR